MNGKDIAKAKSAPFTLHNSTASPSLSFSLLSYVRNAHVGDAVSVQCDQMSYDLPSKVRKNWKDLDCYLEHEFYQLHTHTQSSLPDPPHHKPSKVKPAWWWRVCSLIPSVYFLFKQTLEWKWGLSRLDVGCIGKTAWEGELVRGTVERSSGTLPKQWWQGYVHTYAVLMPTVYSAVEMSHVWAHTHTHTPSGGRSFNLFLPSFCIFGRPSVSLAILQYILRPPTSAWRIKCSNKLSFVFEWLEYSIFDMRSSVITYALAKVDLAWHSPRQNSQDSGLDVCTCVILCKGVTVTS